MKKDTEHMYHMAFFIEAVSFFIGDFDSTFFFLLLNRLLRQASSDDPDDGEK
jgi:hypothetical protein